MTGTVVNLIVLFFLLLTAAVCALTPLLAFAWILWSWRRRAPGVGRARELRSD